MASSVGGAGKTMIGASGGDFVDKSGAPGWLQLEVCKQASAEGQIGVTHVFSTFNSTAVTVTDTEESAVVSSSAGRMGFNGTATLLHLQAGWCDRFYHFRFYQFGTDRSSISLGPIDQLCSIS